MEEHQAQIEEVVDYVFQTLWGTTPRVTPPRQLDSSGALNTMLGEIQICGRFRGTVSVFCSRSFARLAATRMLQVTEPELVDESVDDVLGELTNVIGGSLKMLLGSDPGKAAKLSLPKVSPVLSPGAQGVPRVWFDVESDWLAVGITPTPESVPPC